MNIWLALGAGIALTGIGAAVWWREPLVVLAAPSAAYMQEVRTELRKVTWPGWGELRQSTVVVLIFVIVLGIIIGIMDWAFSKLLIDFLGRAFA